MTSRLQQGFRRYYERAKNRRASVHLEQSLGDGEDKETGAVRLRYRLSGTSLKDDTFDLVVLSVGLVSPETNRSSLKKWASASMSTGSARVVFSAIGTRPGIYQCGVFHAPMDIPIP
jgi:heterodisulfide reductase subunit A